MSKLTDFIAAKAIGDESMATLHRMLQENVGAQEDCLLLAFDALYSANQELGRRVVELEARAKPAIVKP